MGLLRSALLRRAVFGSERWLLRRAREVVAVTDAFRERIEAKGVAADRIAVIPNGVDTGRYFPTDEPPPVDALRRSSPDECVVGYLGTFGRGQGLDAVIDAVRRVRESGRPIRLVAVGDGPERPALERVLSERPAPFVHLGTPIPRDLTRAFYNACDVVLVPHASLPILGDTLPSKIFEAMACARPIVAALGGEGARLVTRSDGGIVAAPGDPAAIADALDRMLALSPAERNAMGDRARRFALAEFDRETLAQRYLERLQRLVPAAIRTERR
jgi:glycosyltransferase involved in cell wall biosynthesis